jgi:hypothetical protein
MEMGAMDAATAVASMVGTLAGVHFGKTILFHFLELVHIHDRSLNVVLTGSEDPYAVSEIADALALTFRLPLLIRTADGYAEQTGLAPAPCTNKGAEGLIRPAVTVARPQLATDVGWRAINAGPVSTAVAPPCGLRVETEGTTTRIVFPYSKAALVVGAAVAAIAGAAGVAITIFASGDERWAGLVLPLAALALLLMGVKSRRHKNLVLSSAGLRYDIAAMGVAPVTVPWTDVRDLSVARTAGSQPGLLIVSSGPEIWIGVGMRIEDLQWLEGVIRSFAADPPE